MIHQVQQVNTEEQFESDDHISIDVPNGADEAPEFADFDWVREDSVKSNSSGRRTPSGKIYGEVSIDVPQRTQRGGSQSPHHGYRMLQHTNAVDNGGSSQVQTSPRRTSKEREHVVHPRALTLDQTQLTKYGHKRGSSVDNSLLGPKYSSLSKLDDRTKWDSLGRSSKGLSPLVHSRHHRSKSMTKVDTLSENDNGASAVGRREGLKRSRKMDTTDIV